MGVAFLTRTVALGRFFAGPLFHNESPFVPGSNTPSLGLDTAEPSTSRWIARGVRRHVVTLTFFLIGIGLVDALGAQVDRRAYALMALWIAVTLAVGGWAATPYAFPYRVRRFAFTMVLDVVFLGLLYLVLDAAQFLGAPFFVYSALVAVATFPRRGAIAFGALVVAVFSAVVLAEVYGLVEVASPLGLPSVRGNYGFAIASIISAAGVIATLMVLQGRLMDAIRSAELRFQLLVRAAPDMVMTFDANGRFVDVNEATLRQSGYTWEEIKRLPNTSFFPLEDWPKVLDARARNLRGEMAAMEVRYVRKDGEVRWVDLTSSPFQHSGHIDAALVIARDITEQKRQTDVLRANDERFRLILSSVKLSFYTIDLAGRVSSLYGEWALRQSDHVREMVGRRAPEIFPSEAAALHEAAFDRVLAGDDVAIEFDMTMPGSSVTRSFRTSLAPLRDADGRVTGGAAVWADVTEAAAAERDREQLLSRLAEADRLEALGHLVSGVAHELNNPLAAILNFTEDLLDDVRPSEDRMALQVIQSQALRSRTIVRDLLTFVRQGDHRPRKLDSPGHVLETLLRAVQPGMNTQGVRFTATVTDGDTPLDLDRAGFEQVVTNLLTNAAHAAGAGGAVRLHAFRENDAFVVRVEDTGSGVDAEDVARIFDPFFTTKATGQGVGLGLSVSMGIVRAHEGSLEVENLSAEAGGGARFTMRLPVSSDPAPVLPARSSRGMPVVRELTLESTPGALPVRKPSLLVIDDEAPIRSVLRRYFERRDWTVDEAVDGAEALGKLMRHDAVVRYDVVLCDLKMPGFSGQELVGRLQTESPGMMGRLILATGDTMAPDVVDFLASVQVPVLEKPFELQTLEQLASQILSAVASPAAKLGAPGQ